jgi:hypothetical protein
MYLAAGTVPYGRTWVSGNHGRQWMRTDYMGKEESFLLSFLLDNLFDQSTGSNPSTRDESAEAGRSNCILHLLSESCGK